MDMPSSTGGLRLFLPLAAGSRLGSSGNVAAKANEAEALHSVTCLMPMGSEQVEQEEREQVRPVRLCALAVPWRCSVASRRISWRVVWHMGVCHAAASIEAWAQVRGNGGRMMTIQLGQNAEVRTRMALIGAVTCLDTCMQQLAF